MLRSIVKCLPMIALLLPSLASGQSMDLVTNGDFSQGNLGFDTQYVQGSCSLEGRYQILTNPETCHGGWQGSDHTGGSGNLMVVNGSISVGRTVWSQTIPVVPGAPYLLRLFVCSLHTKSPAVLTITINGTQVGTVNAPGSVAAWTEFSVLWDAGGAVSAMISILDLNFEFGGNDFGLDDISFTGPTETVRNSWGHLKTIYR